MEPRAFDLVVAGAGVMGLGCALEAALHGQKVAVLDPSLSGQGGGTKASWAAAGILVTRDARAFLSPFREFYVRSIEAYPAWLEALSRLTGRELNLRRGGDYQVYDLEAPEGQRQWETRMRQLEKEHARDFQVSDMLPGFLKEHSPLRKLKALHFPREAFIQNRELLEQLRLAAEKAGVRILAQAALPEYRGGWHFRPPGEDLQSRQFLVCAGAWSARVLESLGFSLPMVPVKGQMLRIPKFYAGEAMVHLNEDFYLVPRGDSLIAGATTEPGVWEEDFTAAGNAFLRDRLERYFPGMAHAAVEQWAGIRPRTRDRLPMMGWVDPERGLALCAGHYKSGVSMAPLAAQCMAKLLTGERPTIDLAPFHPRRRGGLD